MALKRRRPPTLFQEVPAPEGKGKWIIDLPQPSKHGTWLVTGTSGERRRLFCEYAGTEDGLRDALAYVRAQPNRKGA